MSEVKVPVGYKQTEVGVIPEDWEVSNIRNVSLVPTQNGLFYEPKRKGKGIPLINVSDMYKAAPIDISLLELFDAIPNELNTFKVNEGDLFFTRSSVVPSGIAFCNIYESSRKDVVFDSHLIRVRPNKELVYPRFLYLNCLSKHARTALIAEAKTATMTTIDQNAINSCPVLLPPKPEQIAIANALTDTDNLIQSLEKLIAKKEAIKTGTMQQLLTGKTRLPEFATHEDGSPKEFKQTELGKIPEDWDVVTIRESCDLLTGHPFSSSKYSDSGVRLLRGSNIKRGNTDWDSSITRYWPEITSNISHYALNIGDVVISMDGSLVGRSFAQLSESDLPALLLQRVARLRAKTIDQNYLKEWVCSSIFTEHCDLVKTVTAIPHISPADILNFKIATPRNGNEQTAIASILSDMDAEIEAVQDRLEKTKAIKQGMMQQLLTGKVRLV